MSKGCTLVLAELSPRIRGMALVYRGGVSCKKYLSRVEWAVAHAYFYAVQELPPAGKQRRSGLAPRAALLVKTAVGARVYGYRDL